MFCIFFLPSLSSARDFVVVSVGDTYLGTRLVPYLDEYGPAYPFENVAGILNGADAVIMNLESPLTNHSKTYIEKEFHIKAPPYAIESVKSASVDVATLANNHMMDFGEPGLRDTLAALDAAGIARAGAGLDSKEARRPAIFEKDGVRVAVLSYSRTYPLEFYATAKRAGTASGVEANIESDIKKARRDGADIVVVTFHWGAERVRMPKPYQIELAHLSIDSGADLVIGHHPHVTQPIEKYKGGVIFYSLGNFVFGMTPNRALGGAIAKVVFTNDGGGPMRIKDIEAIPLNVDNREVFFKPVILKGAAAAAAIAEMEAQIVPYRGAPEKAIQPVNAALPGADAAVPVVVKD
ncbi:MAG: CapA family protein [Deltaproteobacteria bacterium]|nr:CapA family protein [Deltaproteobacteria bacterium]